MRIELGGKHELQDDMEAVRAEIEAIRKQFEFTVVKGKGVK